MKAMFAAVTSEPIGDGSIDLLGLLHQLLHHLVNGGFLQVVHINALLNAEVVPSHH